MQPRTAALAAKADAPHTEPLLLVRAFLPDGTRYWASRGGTYGGNAYTEALKSGVDLRLGLDPLGRAMRSTGQLILANESDGRSSRISEVLAAGVVAACAVEIDLLMAGLSHPADSLRLFTGMLEVPEEDCADDQAVRLNVLDDGNPLWEGMQDLACARIHKILGTRITRDTWPGADPDVLGKIEPLLYGNVVETRCLPVDAGGVDVLSGTADSVQATIPLSDATRFAGFDASGTVVLGDEEIMYAGKDAATLSLTGCVRGVNGTVAAEHQAGEECWQQQAEYVYLVAGHPCRSVRNVKVDGILKTEGTDYTVQLAGPTLLRFLARPRTSTAIVFTVQPAFGATVVAEQAPGTITVASEQTPGTISTTAEHGHNMDGGSHSHSSTSSKQQLPNGVSFPFTWSRASGSEQRDYSFTDLAGDVSCIWSVKRSSSVLPNGSTIIYAVGTQTWTWNYSTGTPDVWVYSGGVGINTLSITVNANGGATTIVIEEISRDIEYSPSTGASGASGVVANRTGATASSMSALSGATAANMATLSGSTAVSVSRTQNAVATGADRVIGTEVICDVEGYADDGSGTYTGTPNALIVNPADQIRHLFAVHLGLGLATWVDSASFEAARNAWAAACVRCDWGLYGQIGSAELLERLRWSVAARLFQGANGKFKLFVLPLSGSPVLSVAEAADVLDVDHGGGPIRVGRTALVSLYNQVHVLHARHIAGTGYAGYATAADAASQNAYRMVRTLIVENDFVRDPMTAQWLADTYLAWHEAQKWRATLVVDAMPTAHLEPCDKIAITSRRMPGGWSAKEFWIESIGRRVLPLGMKSAATLVCREA